MFLIPSTCKHNTFKYCRVLVGLLPMVWCVGILNNHSVLMTVCPCLKATAGGGGRGMRLAKEPHEFVKLLQVIIEMLPTSLKSSLLSTCEYVFFFLSIVFLSQKNVHSMDSFISYFCFVSGSSISCLKL